VRVAGLGFRRFEGRRKEANSHLQGGIKGIDLDRSGRIVASTRRHQTLRFFETEIVPDKGLFVT
jgi:hypothetical protein